MKVEIDPKGDLFVKPETDFEEEYLKLFLSKNIEAFVKTGIDLSDIQGLKISSQHK